jgi:hypothetical protein
MAEEHFLDAFTEVSIIDAFWDFVQCSSSSNRRFGEYIAGSN